MAGLMNPVMYIILNKSLGMSTGKTAAQASHAAVEAYRLSMSTDPEQHAPPAAHMNATPLYERNEVRLWYKGGHYTKIVLEAEGDNFDMLHDYLGARGFRNALIIDEGRTEIEPFTPTAIGCAIVDKDNPHVQATFGEFKLYSDPRPAGVVIVPPQPNGRIRHIREFLRRRPEGHWQNAGF